MPFNDSEGHPITCESCPFRIGVDCAAMPPIRVPTPWGDSDWGYPPARNPCARHPALGGLKLPDGVVAVADAPVVIPSVWIPAPETAADVQTVTETADAATEPAKPPRQSRSRTRARPAATEGA